jgi:Uma2 family endonuclease
LPNGAIRAPDVAWVRKERIDALTDSQWRRFLPLCPDFVVELRSPSDAMPVLQRKMEEYRAEGAQLGWLLDAQTKTAYVYRIGAAVETHVNPDVLTGDPTLPGFVLNVKQVWAAMERTDSAESTN